MRLLRTLTLLTFLLFIIPGDKLSFPIGMIVTIEVLGMAGLEGFIPGLTLFITIAKAILSIAKSIKPQIDPKLNLLILLIFWAYLLQYTNEFIRYYNTISLSILFIFLLVSSTNLIKTIKQLKAQRI